jgi:hypothetical protein
MLIVEMRIIIRYKLKITLQSSELFQLVSMCSHERFQIIQYFELFGLLFGVVNDPH